jgi:hypothetical protein
MLKIRLGVCLLLRDLLHLIHVYVVAVLFGVIGLSIFFFKVKGVRAEDLRLESEGDSLTRKGLLR